VCTLLVQELFDFVTDASISEELADRYLQKALQIAADRRAVAPSVQQSAESTAAVSPDKAPILLIDR
jgi:hypothetical protein